MKIRFAINTYGLAHHFGDPAVMIRTAQLAEEAGFSQFVITDHVVMGEQTHQYPYGPWPTPLDLPWWEPMTVLSAVAASTQRIGLSTGVLLSTLRPAALLAKQAATLDQLANGRLELGLGAGWQEAEFAACGVDFRTRRSYFVEQIRVMKRLWTERKVSFHGRHHDFDDVWCHPQPRQPRGIPISVGIAPSDANLPWICELADGWLPIDDDPGVYAPLIRKIGTALAAAGRDPATFRFRARFPYVTGADGQADLDATFARLPALVDAGLTDVEVYPIMYLRSTSTAELENVIGRCAERMRAAR
jgi:probable F420-dependent oxidoreductase